ncbi:hypothetical protein MCPGFBBE_00914 [Streptococcus equi subsp. zooepidemicus]|uniref:hypothetical protein n=1 Tax=Streptococcus equi TaxID=1336 RepID=UPI00197CF872|nr:hypothetical protein [Streptococcus equi]QTZ58812.1 hypothetical protein MCPGFBBE_00914 [Streptococcus equi subsp. zooepidemicus]
MIVYLKQHKNYWKLVSIAALIIILGGVITTGWLNGDRVVKYIGEHIELGNGKPITKIEFIEFQQNLSTGTWTITATVNNKYNIVFGEDYLGGEIETAYYTYKEFKYSDEKLNNSNKDKVEIIYYKES